MATGAVFDVGDPFLKGYNVCRDLDMLSLGLDFIDSRR